MKTISEKDRSRLRALAAHQIEVAQSDDMRRIYADWRAHGSFKHASRPMVTIELWTFAEHILPELMQCEGESARKIEEQLLAAVIPYEMFGDDTPVRPYYNVQLKKDFVPFGLPTRMSTVANGRSVNGAGQHCETYFHDLEQDWHLIAPSTIRLNVAATEREVRELNELFGDLLPARRAGMSVPMGVAFDIMERISMEDLYVALYDAPERVHEMTSRLVDDYDAYCDLLEKSGVLLPACGDEPLLEGSYCFTDSLPSEGEGLTTKDLWGYLDAEEMNDVAPEMYKEFIIDHYMKLAARFGAISYGCCEAVHRFWDGCIETLPNLRKVSISAWCDEYFMGERLRGREIVFHRKPTANLLGIQRELDEDAVRAYFRETAQAASGCKLEVSQRDIYLLHGNLPKVRRYVSLIRETFDKYWRA